MTLKENHDQVLGHSTKISRRKALGVFLTSGLLPAMTRVAWSIPQKIKGITPKQIGVTARTRNEVLKRAFSQMQFLNVLYGLDLDEPVVLKDDVAYVKCKDPLKFLPEIAEIKSSYSGDTKIGQLHAMLTAIYTALHCNGEDGVTDKDTYTQLYAGFTHSNGFTTRRLPQSKSSLINMMKMQAGLIPADQTVYQRDLKSVDEYINNLSRWKAGGFMKVATGQHNEIIYQRIALGLKSMLDFITSNPRILRSSSAQKTIAEFDSNFSRFLNPEVSMRLINFYLGSKSKTPGIPKIYPARDYTHIFNKQFRLRASYNSFRVLFGDESLPKISAWIPFKKSAMPEYRIWYAKHKKEFTIPLYTAYNTNKFETAIPNLSEFKDPHFLIDSVLPLEYSFYGGAVRAFNLSVGLSDFGRELRVDRTSELEKEAKRLGVKIASHETDSQGGLLLTAGTGGAGSEEKWGEKMWPQ